MEQNTLHITAAEEEFYGGQLILLEGAISEFLSCMDMVRRYQVSLGRRDPVYACQARIKSAQSMRKKLECHGLPPEAAYIKGRIWDGAGVRLICPFVQDIYTAAGLVRTIPGVQIRQEKDYISAPKPNGYRSYHMILSLPLRFLGKEGGEPVWLELQLRTIAMDCWASIEHQLKYKRDVARQKLIVQELKRCADEITSTDLSLQTIRELIESGEEEPPCEF